MSYYIFPQINLHNQESLDVIHRLFESVSPSVFRPVDSLLKTLLATPSDIVSSISIHHNYPELQISLL